MMLGKRTHPTTGEVAFQYVDWHPTDLAPRQDLGTTGAPLRSILVCADRVGPV